LVLCNTKSRFLKLNYGVNSYNTGNVTHDWIQIQMNRSPILLRELSSRGLF
jgi:hypothetical protein